MGEENGYGRLEVAMIPPLPVQEAEAEAQRLAGAASAPENQQSTSFAVPIDTTTDKEDDVHGGDSIQVPTGGPGSEGAAGVSHMHYWVHTVTETIERGYSRFNSVAWQLAEGEPVQLCGLDDLRPRANLICLELDADTTVYVGNRDVLAGASPQSTGVRFASVGATFDYQARAEIWAVAIGGAAVVGVTSYQSEPTSDTLAAESKSSKGIQ